MFFRLIYYITDQEKCIGCGLCVGLAEAVFALNDDGKAVAGEVTPDDEEAVEEYENDIINFTYEDMKFYAYCYFEKKFHSAHIYICSDKEIDGYPFICVLTPKIYHDIKENKTVSLSTLVRF